MKTLTAQFFVAAFIVANAAVAFANPPKSKIITGNDSTLVITVPDDHFLKITNFTQDGGTDRAVVEVTLSGQTENGNQVTIAGPAIVKIRPIVGAKLFISYRMEGD